MWKRCPTRSFFPWVVSSSDNLSGTSVPMGNIALVVTGAAIGVAGEATVWDAKEFGASNSPHANKRRFILISPQLIRPRSESCQNNGGAILIESNGILVRNRPDA